MTKNDSTLKNFLIEKGIPTLALLIVSFVLLYGNNLWYSREKGEQLEKTQIRLEEGQKHTNEKLEDIKTILLQFAQSRNNKGG